MTPDSATATSPDESVRTVLRLEEELQAAFERRDMQIVERLYAPEFTLNSPTLRVQSRAETLELLRTNRAMRQTNHQRSIEAAYASGDVVVIMGGESLVWEGTGTELDGQPTSRRFIDVWRRIEGHWRKIARQATPTPSRP